MPREAFALAATRAEKLVVVGIGVTRVANLDAARGAAAAVREVLPDMPLLLGGQAIRNPEVADLVDLLGAAEWASDGLSVVHVVERLAAERRRRALAWR